MKYPKLRNGPHPVGEALNRAIQGIGAPFVSASGIDYGANKYGGGAEVYGGSPDGFYCLGSLDPLNQSAPPFKIVASNNARGSFTKRGEWDGGAFASPALPYVGKGLGVVPTASTSSSSTISTTRYAKEFKEVLTFFWGQDGFSGTGWLLHSGARYVEDDAAKWTYGIIHASYYEGTPWESEGNYLFTLDGGKSWLRIALTYGPGYFHGLPAMHRLTPDKSIMLLPTYVVDDDSKQWLHQQDPRLSTLALVADYGNNFTDIGGGDLVGMLDVSPTDPVTASFFTVNQRIQGFVRDMYAIPLATGDVLYLSMAKYYDGQLAGGPVVDDGMWVFRGGHNTAPIFIGKLAIPGVPTWYAYPLQFNGLPVGVAIPESPTEVCRLFVGNEGGTSWTFKPMPYPRHSTGALTAIDEDTLVCPMYDAEELAYVLMQTRDLGETWTKRAVIKKGAPAPQPGDGFMTRFATLSYLRKDGFPAPTFPGAPWMGDDRITPPWEI